MNPDRRRWNLARRSLAVLSLSLGLVLAGMGSGEAGSAPTPGPSAHSSKRSVKVKPHKTAKKHKQVKKAKKVKRSGPIKPQERKIEAPYPGVKPEGTRGSTWGFVPDEKGNGLGAPEAGTSSVRGKSTRVREAEPKASSALPGRIFTTPVPVPPSPLPTVATPPTVVPPPTVAPPPTRLPTPKPTATRKPTPKPTATATWEESPTPERKNPYLPNNVPKRTWGKKK